MLTKDAKTSEKVSDEYRIDLIRKLRNELIKYFLEDSNLRSYFKKRFKYQPNALRMVFIKKELQDLLISPVDLVHYASLLIEMKQVGTASVTIKNEELFYEELDSIFSKYLS